MTFEQLLPWVVAANALMTFGQTAYMLLSTRATKALKEIDTLVARLNKDADERKLADQAIVGRFHLAEARLLQVEARIDHLPNRDQAHSLQLAIEKLGGRMEAMDERMTGRIDTLNERVNPLVAGMTRLHNVVIEKLGEK